MNANKPPTVVDRRAGSPKKVPLFPEQYDWNEEKRVLKALDKLYTDSSVELWEELIQREKDTRYAVTIVSPVETPKMLSVGSICSELAYSTLVGVFRQHLPPDPRKDGSSITLDVTDKSLGEWRKARKDKALYELQIEVCETAIDMLSKTKGIPEDQMLTARRRIADEIEKLKAGKRPFIPKRESFQDFKHVYTRELAKRIREVVSSGSAEDIIILK
jgi:hypothetical protein